MSHASVLVAVDPTQDVQAAIAEQMEPFDENGKWFGDGSRWDWWVIGGRFSGRLSDSDVLRRADVDLAALRARAKAEWSDTYAQGMADDAAASHRELIWGIRDGETLEQYLERHIGSGSGFPAHYAFLRNRCWNESERMGWFGGSTKTECAVITTEGVCLYEKNGAKVVSWNSPHDEAAWNDNFFERFIRDLPPETLLVTVDYHV